MVNDEDLISDTLNFADEDDRVFPQSLESWKVLIVDDEIEIHTITQLALQDFVFDSKQLQFLNAYSGKEARQILFEHSDIAIVLLDVIMESDDAGLITTKYIRETLQNRAIRIVLRTGQPGQAPEQKVIIDYDIDDYKTKTELTSQKLFTTIITALRSYSAYTALEAYSELEVLNANLKRTNLELIRAAKVKDEFLSTMSHEFRTPLNAIMGMSEIMEEEIYGTINDKQRQALQTIKGSGKHLLELINDILDVSKIMAGMLKLDIQPVAIADLCNSSLEFLQYEAGKKKIQLTLDLSADLQAQEIKLDVRRMRQVLINLLSNAIKFTPDAGKVCLAVKREDGSNWTEFTVTDTGIGIAESDRNKVFQPFIQIDSGLNRKYEGSGLGLALVKQIVELHGGDIDFSSQFGQGSCFTVRIPINNSSVNFSLNSSLDSVVSQ